MRVQDLIALGQRYLALGIGAALVFAVIFGGIYLGFYRGKRKVPVGRILWLMVFLCYLVVVLGVTLMDRNSYWQNSRVMPLFYSYKDAWREFSAVAWRNIILNICMFVPFGMLLPLGILFFRRFWRTYLAGLLFTVIIEGVQLFGSLGIFELDDILNNTVGTMIGYGLFALVMLVWEGRKHREKQRLQVGQVFCFQLPLLLTVAAFAVIFTAYAGQELGNLKEVSLYPVDSETFKISSAVEFDETVLTVPVYQTAVYSKEEVAEFAADFFENLGSKLDEKSNDFYEETAFLRSEDRYHMRIHYRGGDFSFTDFKTTFPEKELAVKADATEEELREAFARYGVEIPADAVMKYDVSDGRVYFSLDMLPVGETLRDGTISGTYYENDCFSDIDYDVITCEYYKDYEIISAKEAYEKICRGEFVIGGAETYEIEISGCTLEYVLDSKGFYQPCYAFSCEINGSGSRIMIPAIP